MSISWGNRTLTLFAVRLTAGFAAVTLAVALGETGAAVTHAPPAPGEERASRAFDAAKKLGSPDLYAFLKPMPKGAELHYHLGGGIYAESILAEAVKQGSCVDPDAARFVPQTDGKEGKCSAGSIPASEAVRNQKLYDKLVDNFSMRSFVPSAGFSGHDKFFSGGRNNGPSGLTGQWLAEATIRAAGQNVQYLEIMSNPGLRKAIALGTQMGWPADAENSITRDELAKLRDRLLAAGLRDEIPAGSKEMEDAEATQRAIEKCSGLAVAPSPCSMKIHYLYTVSRGQPPEQVFASALAGFELNSADPRYVGINFAAPEDGRVSMKDYHLHMLMVEYLHSVYPKVHITLHAGELAPGLVPPEGLRFHIREAIEVAHAERIGHGVDVLYEDDAAGLLREMAAKHVMVEINLTSNDGILGVRGYDHPLSGYRAAHVPVALSTDDEGNSRIDLTHEYVKGALEQHLSYLDLKQMARTSLEHAFLYGESLWVTPDDFTRRKPVCAAPITVSSKPSAACAAMLEANERAAQQWDMERRFAVFEASAR
jgi:adenosine deaminase